MFDISQEEDYRELTLEEQYLVNGGAAMDQRDQAAMAAAQEKGDQDAMDAILAKYETPKNDSASGGKTTYGTGTSGNPGTGSGNVGVTESGGNNNTSTSSGGPSGSPGGSGPESGGSDNRGYPSSMDGYYDAKLKKLHEYNPDETNTDKKFTARDFNGKHLMTVYYANAVKFEDAAAYYLSFGKWGTAETTTYDGIGLTDEKGNITRILTKEKEVLDYVESFDPRNKTYEPYLLNNETIENNQYKTEKAFYGKFEKTRNGVIAKFDGGELSSKTLVEGPAALFEAGVINLNASCYFSEEHTEWGVGANLGSLGFEGGFQIGNTRFTIGGELAAGINFGYRRETTDNKSSYQVRLPILKSLRFTIEE